MDNFMNGLFKQVAPGMCRISMDGDIAVKTSSGYKSYNVKTGRLTNCDSFVFDVGEEFFFVVPTNKAKPGDIILANGKPKCVVDVADNRITVINYEDSVIESMVPERHVFLGNTYFYGKIVSMFGDTFAGGKANTENIMKFMMVSSMMKGNGTAQGSSMASNPMLAFMLMNGMGTDGNLFDGLFDFGPDNEADEEKEDE